MSLSMSSNPRARQVLYAVAFLAAALSLFAPLVSGEVGATLADALRNLSALATASATATALSNMSPAPSPEVAPVPTLNASATVPPPWDSASAEQ